VIRTNGFSPMVRASSRVRWETIDLDAQTLMIYTSGREKGLKNRALYGPVWFTATSARCCVAPTLYEDEIRSVEGPDASTSSRERAPEEQASGKSREP
jgi:hypothetical protein